MFPAGCSGQRDTHSGRQIERVIKAFAAAHDARACNYLARKALNQVYGDCYEVSAAEVEDPQAFEERWPKDQFIFDVQTHHVDVGRKWYDDTRTGRGVR